MSGPRQETWDAPNDVGCWACGALTEPVRDAPVSDLRRCGSCHLMFSHRARESVRGLYDDRYFAEFAGGDYLSSEPARRLEARARLGWMSTLGIRPPGRLLDVGAAAGYFLDEARRQGWSIEGVEPNDGLSERARRDLRMSVQTGFAEDVELGRAAYAAVCMWHTLEHIPDPLDTLLALRKALRPEGVLCVEVPNWRSRLAHRLGWSWKPLELDVHVAHYGPASLTALLRSSGYEIKRLETVPFVTYVRASRRRFPRRVLLAFRQRAYLRDPHPTDHELLRAVAGPTPGDTSA